MADVACWSQLCKLAFCGLKWILIGDFNQYQPIYDKWCGKPLTKTSSTAPSCTQWWEGIAAGSHTTTDRSRICSISVPVYAQAAREATSQSRRWSLMLGRRSQ